MSNLITTQINQLAERFDLPQSEELYQVLKATAFKGDVSDAQLSALLIVAKQFGLNPWTKEIYAFPDKGGIVPVVGVDGWSRIINEHPQFDGQEFEYGPAFQHKNKAAHEWIECVIYRKDRSKPTRIREYFDEVNRDSATPWNSHPKRMHRHKALIQCARLAFGFGGIFDTDEAERIVENMRPETTVIDGSTGEIQQKAATASKTLLIYTDDQFTENMVKWRKVIASGIKDVAGVLATVATIATLTEDQIAAIKNIPAELAKAAGQRKPERTGPEIAATYAEVADKLRKATTQDGLNEAATLIAAVADEKQRGELNTIYEDCAATLG